MGWVDGGIYAKKLTNATFTEIFTYTRGQKKITACIIIINAFEQRGQTLAYAYIMARQRVCVFIRRTINCIYVLYMCINTERAHQLLLLFGFIMF